ncbi:hypothetical protein ABZ608_41480 [Streptomyces sp. NPDC013172]|uniref:DUF1876 domain-containing protein n=1 Tax=Streptomyces atriruber TaxID=545121 RepID=A0ABV3C129_9ACTN
MGRNYSWTARISGQTVADGTVTGTNNHTPDRVEREAALAVSLEAGVDRDQVAVTVEEKKPLRQQVAEARARTGK